MAQKARGSAVRGSLCTPRHPKTLGGDAVEPRAKQAASRSAASRASTEQAKERIRAIFKTWDRDGNGTLSRDEVHRLMMAIGGKISKAEFDKVFDEVDTNGNDVVEIDEFVDWVMAPGSCLEVTRSGKLSHFDLTTALRPLWEVFDTSGDGIISFEEFKDIHAILQGAILAQVQQEEASKDSESHGSLKRLASELGMSDDPLHVFEELDDDKGGTISLDEFVDWQREAVEHAGISKDRLVELVSKLAALLQTMVVLQKHDTTEQARKSRAIAGQPGFKCVKAPLREEISKITDELYKGSIEEEKAKSSGNEKDPSVWDAMPPHISKQALLRVHMRTPVPTLNVEDIEFSICPCVPALPGGKDGKDAGGKADGKPRRHRRWLAKVLRTVKYRAKKKRPGGAAAEKAVKDPAATPPPEGSGARLEETLHYYSFEEGPDGRIGWQELQDDGVEYDQAVSELDKDHRLLAVLVTEADFVHELAIDQMMDALANGVEMGLLTVEQLASFNEEFEDFAVEQLTKTYSNLGALSAERRQMLVNSHKGRMTFPPLEIMSMLEDCGAVQSNPLWDDKAEQGAYFSDFHAHHLNAAAKPPAAAK